MVSVFYGWFHFYTACNLLSADATAFGLAFYGQGSGPIVLDDVACVGTETNILSCPFDNVTTDCTHREDAGVQCMEQRKDYPFGFFDHTSL